MIIYVGDCILEVIFKCICEGIEMFDMYLLFDVCKVVLFVVFGVFMLMCLVCYLFGYVEKFEVFCQCGIDVYCMVVNDLFVMKVWVVDQYVFDGLLMLFDGNVELICVFGLEFDVSVLGMGICLCCFVLYVVDGVVCVVWVEQFG